MGPSNVELDKHSLTYNITEIIKPLLSSSNVDPISVSKKKATTPIIVVLLLSTIILSGILAYEHDNPVWILGAMGLNVVFGLIAKFTDNYLQK